MTQPKVSVVIPAYNGADYLGEAIESVLNQSYQNFEIIIVNDASPDHTPEVVNRFSDTRIKYFTHDRNRGLPATRNTGVRASSGELIALLDQDDLFHPEKLHRHVTFLEKNPQAGATYNSRFDVVGASRTIRELWRAPFNVSLADLILGYPFAPSDLVLRKEWLLKIGLFDESNVFHGEDLNTNCRLAMAGCHFALVDQALNYRRYHPARIRKNLAGSLDSTLKNLQMVLDDPRCPENVKKLRDLAYANNYLVWAYWALAQNETESGQNWLRLGTRLNPTVLDGTPSELMNFLVSYTADDERGNLEDALKQIFEQLPPEYQAITRQYDWALARAHLLKGTRAIIWNDLDDGQHHFARAIELHAEIDEPFVRLVVHQLLGYENEFGINATQTVVDNLVQSINSAGDQRSARQLKGTFLINRAFQNYRAQKYTEVPKKVMQAVSNDPAYLVNRGVMAILFRSMIGMMKQAR